MADENQNEDAVEQPEAAAPEKEKKSGGGLLKILLIAGIPTLTIIAIAGVLLFTSFGRELVGLDSKNAKKDIAEEIVELPENITYYEMPELLVNIQSSSKKRKPFLRLAVKFEVHDPEAIATIDLLKPRIIDSFQVYLRELRVDDLEGSAGSQRLKEELLKRVNAVSAPAKIMDVLFQVFVVQ